MIPAVMWLIEFLVESTPGATRHERLKTTGLSWLESVTLNLGLG
jgi:hypothetical protein